MRYFRSKEAAAKHYNYNAQIVDELIRKGEIKIGIPPFKCDNNCGEYVPAMRGGNGCEH